MPEIPLGVIPLIIALAAMALLMHKLGIFRYFFGKREPVGHRFGKTVKMKRKRKKDIPFEIIPPGKIYLPPVFRPLRVNDRGNKITYYFVNEGGVFVNPSVIPEDDFIVSLSPGDIVFNRDSGCIRFVFKSDPYQKFHRFVLEYNDELANRRQTWFYYSPHERRIFEDIRSTVN